MHTLSIKRRGHINSFIYRLRKGRALTAVVLSALFISSVFTPAQAETINCTPITSVPATITTQGIYCLTGDLSTTMTSGYAIALYASNVTIDLNGYKLGGLGAGPGTSAIGIYAYQMKNITIKNGSVRGFMNGIAFDDASPYTTSSGHLIEDIRADGNTWNGIEVVGTGIIVRNNQVVKTGGSTVIGRGSAHGIIAVGAGSSIVNNDITNTVELTNSDISSGVWVSGCNGCVVENNRISNSTRGPGASYGVYMYSSSNVMAVNNRMSTSVWGIYYDTGSTGKYRDNLTGSVSYPYTGGTNIGNNN